MDALTSIFQLLIKLRTAKNAKNLPWLTNLVAMLPNITWKNGKYQMVTRFFSNEKWIYEIERKDAYALSLA